MRIFRLKIICLSILIVLLPMTGFSTEYFVSSASEVSSAMSSAQPGDTLTMTNGRWTNQRIIFDGDGAPGMPILLRAETPGLVILDGNSTLRIAGSYLVADGLLFRNGALSGDHVVQFRNGSSNQANNCRLTNSAIISYNPANTGTRYFWVSLYGTNNRVDHCYFADQNHSGVTVVVWLDGIPTDHRIDNNVFADRPSGGGENGWETIRIGTSGESGTNARVIVEHNYFYRCDGEIEIISNKSNENIFRYNTFEDCDGQLTLRHGKRCIVEGNFFFGNNISGSSGVRVIDRDHIVKNNYFEGLNGNGFRAAVSLTNGVPNSPLNRYFQVINARVLFNTFVDCANPLDIGSGMSSELSLPPLDCIIANNIVQGSGTGNLIQYTDPPINMTYESNFMFGAPLGIDTVPGLILTDPMLAIGAEGLFRPQTGSPAIDGAGGSYPDVTDDVDGQPRDGVKDIGADEGSTAPVLNTPLSGDDIGSVVGPDWFPLVEQIIVVPPGHNTLSDSFATATPFAVLELMPGEFTLDEKIIVNIPVSFRAADSSQRPVIRNTNPTTNTRILFEIQEGGSLNLDGFELDGMAGSATPAKYLIRTDDDPFPTPYTLEVRNSYLHDVVLGDDGNFFRAYPGTFAESIIFSNCLFYNSGKEGIRLKDEADESSLYNVDLLEISNCTFWHTRKEAVYVYAGDSAPFSDGPRITINHTTFDDCGYDDSRIIYLRECDLATVKNSIFTNSPGNSSGIIMAGFGTVLSYSDTLNIGPVVLNRSANMGAGMVSLDPLYADRLNGDFTLGPNSPVEGIADDGLALGDLRWSQVMVGIDDDAYSLARSFDLMQNYPNPFNPETQIRYQISDIRYQNGNDRLINLVVFDIQGRKVRTLVNKTQVPGSYKVSWDGRDNGGREVASGVYFYRLQAGSEVQTRKLILMR